MLLHEAEITIKVTAKPGAANTNVISSKQQFRLVFKMAVRLGTQFTAHAPQKHTQLDPTAGSVHGFHTRSLIRCGNL